MAANLTVQGVLRAKEKRIRGSRLSNNRHQHLHPRLLSGAWRPHLVEAELVLDVARILEEVPLLIALGAHATEDMRLMRSFSLSLELRPGDAHLAILILLHDYTFTAAEERMEGTIEEEGDDPDHGASQNLE